MLKYISDVRKKSAILPIAEQKNIYPACERIHHQEKDKNHQWMLCRVGRDTDQRCGQPSASSNIASLENQRLYYTKLRPRALFLKMIVPYLQASYSALL